jgi:putative NADH-flavin reductase
MKQMETLLRESDVNWTVVRPSGLFETPAVTDYQVAEDHIRGQFTSRADLADCMLKQLATDQYSRKVMAVATFSVRPSVVKFMLQEAFKEPSKTRVISSL